MSNMHRVGLSALLLLCACGDFALAHAEPLACDDGPKTAFHPDVDTTVIAVRLLLEHGREQFADAPNRATSDTRH